MKLTIDTQTDTHDDIKKVLHILTQILERKGNSELPSSNSSLVEEKPVDTTPMMGMFRDSVSSSEPVESLSTDTPPDFTYFLNLNNKKEEEKKNQPKIEFF